MKITKTYLKQIIKEELEVMEEGVPSLINQMNYLIKMREARESFKKVLETINTKVQDREEASRARSALYDGVSNANIAIEILLRKYVFSKEGQPASEKDLSGKEHSMYSLFPLDK